jgi:hypothetical protein
MQTYQKIIICAMAFAGVASVGIAVADADLPAPDCVAAATTLSDVAVEDAKQAVAVDGEYFYAIDDAGISKHDKKTGALVAKWENTPDLPIIHFDSAAVIDGKIYLAHSNYPHAPMISSIEIFDAGTLQHLESHSFGIERGSFTWIDRDAKGRWWGAFGNYDKIMFGSTAPYGGKENTQIVRFNDSWQIEEAFILPPDLLGLFGKMSNSGGSFGPDGRLYITGHDNSEIYVMEEPPAGSIMTWAGTIKADITGQGIAWDRSAQQPTLYGIKRDKAHGNRVTVHRMPTPPFCLERQIGLRVEP